MDSTDHDRRGASLDEASLGGGRHPDLDTEAGEYLELHGGRRGAGDTLVREVGWEAAQRLLRHKSPETTMDVYLHISAGEIAEDAGDAFNEADRR